METEVGDSSCQNAQHGLPGPDALEIGLHEGLARFAIIFSKRRALAMTQGIFVFDIGDSACAHSPSA